MLSAALINCYAIGFSSGAMTNLVQEVSLLKPTIFASFPAFYNQLYRSTLVRMKISYQQGANIDPSVFKPIA